jgi:hypothetical protein
MSDIVCINAIMIYCSTQPEISKQSKGIQRDSNENEIGKLV